MNSERSHPKGENKLEIELKKILLKRAIKRIKENNYKNATTFIKMVLNEYKIDDSTVKKTTY